MNLEEMKTVLRLEDIREGHRGDFTESIIDYTNQYLLNNKLALVDKIPTPVKVLKREGVKITDAFFEKKGVLDYLGVCQGLPIAFDSKETNQISLPLSNIQKHQFKYIKHFIEQDGYAFIICHFKKLEKFYMIPGEIVLDYYYKSFKGGRKSIPEKELDSDYEIKFIKNKLVIDYLTPLNVYYNQRKKGLLKL